MEISTPGKLNEMPLVEHETEVVASVEGIPALRKVEDGEEVAMPNPEVTLADEERLPMWPAQSPVVVPNTDVVSEIRHDEFQIAPDWRWHPRALLSMLSLGLLAFYREGRDENGSKAGQAKRRTRGC
jgi:hypothetical protein